MFYNVLDLACISAFLLYEKSWRDHLKESFNFQTGNWTQARLSRGTKSWENYIWTSIE